MATLTITPGFESHWGNAPFDYTSTVNAVCTMFQNGLVPKNTCNVTINFDYGFRNGTAIGGNGASNTGFFESTSYSGVRTALQGLSNKSSLQTTAYTNYLPSSDIFGGSEAMHLSIPHACALGLDTVTNGFLTAWVGLGSSFAGSVDTDGTQTSSAFSTIAHEVSEVLGRLTNIGAGTPANYYPMDMWTYSGVSTRAFAVGNYYLSGDDGNTSIATLFNNGGNPNNGDSSDTTIAGDAFNAFVQSAAPSRSSSLPLQDHNWKTMNLIGWQLSASGLTWAGLDPAGTATGAGTASGVTRALKQSPGLITGTSTAQGGSGIQVSNRGTFQITGR